MAMAAAARSHPDRDLGVGAAEAAVEAFDWARDPLAHQPVDGVITLADAEAVAADGLRPTSMRSPRSAPLITVSTTKRRCRKCSRTRCPGRYRAAVEGRSCRDAGLAARAFDHLGGIAARCADAGDDGRIIDPRVILGLNKRREDDIAARPSHHDGDDDHEHDDFDSVAISLPRRRIRKYWPNPSAAWRRNRIFWRVKGYVAVTGKRCGYWCRPSANACAASSIGHGAIRPDSQLVVIAERHHIDRRRHRGNAGGLIGHAWRLPRQLRA